MYNPVTKEHRKQIEWWLKSSVRKYACPFDADPCYDNYDGYHPVCAYLFPEILDLTDESGESLYRCPCAGLGEYFVVQRVTEFLKEKEGEAE